VEEVMRRVARARGEEPALSGGAADAQARELRYGAMDVDVDADGEDLHEAAAGGGAPRRRLGAAPATKVVNNAAAKNVTLEIDFYVMGKVTDIADDALVLQPDQLTTLQGHINHKLAYESGFGVPAWKVFEVKETTSDTLLTVKLNMTRPNTITSPTMSGFSAMFKDELKSGLGEEARNAPFCPSQEKFDTVVLRAVKNISEAP
jgi:hypothetical protein